MNKYMSSLVSSVAAILLLAGCSNGTSYTVTTSSQIDGLVTYQADDDYIPWLADEVTSISFSNNTANVDNNTGVIISDNIVSIRTSGTYVLSGTLSDGQVIVDAEDSGTVRLIFNGVSISSSTSAPIYIKQADKTVISLEEGTENSITDAANYQYDEENGDEPDSTIYSKDDLTINGSGTLIVKGTYNDGISSNDDLLITGGTIQVDALDDGIVGRDLFAMKNANISITAQGDGLKSSNDEDENKGNIVLESGSLSIDAAGDGIQSEKAINVVEGEYTIIAGGGSPEIIESSEEFGMMGSGMAPGGNMRPEDTSSIIDQLINDGDISDELKEELQQAKSFEEIEGIIQENPDLQQILEESRKEQMNTNSQVPPEKPTQNSQSEEQTSSSSNGNNQGFEGMQPPNLGEMPEGMNPSDENTAPLSSTEQTTEVTSTEDTISTKGMKAGTELNIYGGTIHIDSLEDAIHSNQDLALVDGNITLKSGDDGLHADSNVSISGGDITIEKSLEGIEGKNITISDGIIHLTSEDDGINVNVVESGGMMGMAHREVTNSESTNSESDKNTSAESTTADSGKLLIEGGYLSVNANGDGLDSNSSIHMTGGTVLVYGPTSSGNGTLDYSQTFNMEGGILIAAGSSGMVQSISDDSTQNAVMMTFDSMESAGTTIYIEDEDGNPIIGLAPEKEFQTIVISSPSIESGKTYTFHSGGILNGNSIDGLFSDGFTYENGLLTFYFESSTDKTTYLNEDGVTTSQPSGMMGGQGQWDRNKDNTESSSTNNE